MLPAPRREVLAPLGVHGPTAGCSHNRPQFIYLRRAHSLIRRRSCVLFSFLFRPRIFSCSDLQYASLISYIFPSQANGDTLGSWQAPTTVAPLNRSRSYAANAFLLPNIGRTNLVVYEGAVVSKIDFASTPSTGGAAATGVEYIPDGGSGSVTVPLRSGGRVVVTAGMFVIIFWYAHSQFTRHPHRHIPITQDPRALGDRRPRRSFHVRYLEYCESHERGREYAGTLIYFSTLEFLRFMSFSLVRTMLLCW